MKKGTLQSTKRTGKSLSEYSSRNAGVHIELLGYAVLLSWYRVCRVAEVHTPFARLSAYLLSSVKMILAYDRLSITVEALLAPPEQKPSDKLFSPSEIPYLWRLAFTARL